MNVEFLGQVFTREDIVSRMISLIKNGSYILEPSAGDGSFINALSNKNITGIEIDERFTHPKVINMDFFDYSTNNKFPTVIGNPPYVEFKKIFKSTKDKLDKTLFDNRSNLYLFFIEKCFRHLEPGGELIFITPRDFIKLTASIKLNNLLYENGTITHFYDLGDQVVFKGFSPTCSIWRYVKDDYSRRTITNEGEKKFINMGGQFAFVDGNYTINLKDHFFVKVGGVSGLDPIFINENGNKEFVNSETRTTGKTRRMFYNIENDFLLSHKDELLDRRIKTFDESNWYMWGRNYYESDQPRIYVNCKTRISSPFYLHECNNFDGSVLGIFPKYKMDMNKMVDKFNSMNWQELGFKAGGRYIFSQKSLENILLPNNFFD